MFLFSFYFLAHSCQQRTLCACDKEMVPRSLKRLKGFRVGLLLTNFTIICDIFEFSVIMVCATGHLGTGLSNLLKHSYCLTACLRIFLSTPKSLSRLVSVWLGNAWCSRFDSKSATSAFLTDKLSSYTYM